MSKNKRMSIGILLAIINLAWYAICTLLLAGNAWQCRVRRDQVRMIATMNRELRWQSHVAAKAAAAVKDLPELRFLVGAMEMRDWYLYEIARCAWKYGRRLERWSEVRNGPALVMSVIHRESNFYPGARSYRVKRDENGMPLRDENGSEIRMPVGHGAMQLNLGFWKLRLNIDPERIDEIPYNVELGVRILDGCLEESGGNLSDALFRYWGGQLAGGRYTYPPKVLDSKYFDAHPTGTIGTMGAMR